VHRRNKNLPFLTGYFAAVFGMQATVPLLLSNINIKNEAHFRAIVSLVHFAVKLLNHSGRINRTIDGRRNRYAVNACFK
jgi:hypothetical protein